MRNSLARKSRYEYHRAPPTKVSSEIRPIFFTVGNVSLVHLSVIPLSLLVNSIHSRVYVDAGIIVAKSICVVLFEGVDDSVVI